MSEECATLLDSAACGILQTDATGVIIRVNRLFCTWIGRDASELIGACKIQDLFTIGGRIFHQTHWVPLLQMQQSVSEVKFDIVHRNGSTVPIVLNGIRRHQHGIVVHDLAAFIARDRDTYEREILATGKRLAQIAEASAKLEEQAKDRALFAEQMLGIVSHDLRNPLAAVEMSAVGLLGSDVTPEQRVAIERISRATSRAHRLIRELLDFTQARIGHGIAVHVKPIHLPTVIHECLDELRHAFPDSELHHESDEEHECESDADRIIQLVGNLVTNAIAYGAPDRPITIATRLTADTCTIVVRNEGPPIPPATMSLLFQPLTRGLEGPNGDRSIGLGLYIVREIARAHRGDVSVVSTAESGTAFTVVLPRRAPRD
ncbi:MAG: HAMP domain-containing histidine kinase [Phycisphaerae bacterium]|nr:HAMP domain-containing histidine kinase [Gemmatimonadaceae bacterium]